EEAVLNRGSSLSNSLFRESRCGTSSNSTINREYTRSCACVCKTGNRWHSNLFAFRSGCARDWRGSISRKTPCTRFSKNRTDCGLRTVLRRFRQKLRRRNSGSCWLCPRTRPCSSSIEKLLPKMAAPSNLRARPIAAISTALLCARFERRSQFSEHQPVRSKKEQSDEKRSDGEDMPGVGSCFLATGDVDDFDGDVGAGREYGLCPGQRERPIRWGAVRG